MPTRAEQTIADRLAELRPAIVARVAEQLAASMPVLGGDRGAAPSAAEHHAQMYATAQRFHDLVQLSVAADERLTHFEYDWASRVLQPKGVTWEHQLRLIEIYCATAVQLAGLSDEERADLGLIAARLRAAGAQAYHR